MISKREKRQLFAEVKHKILDFDLIFRKYHGNYLCKKYFKKHESSQILSRKERFFEFEEIKQGNLERECFEENCNDEERLEVFDNHQKDYKVKMIFEVCIKQRIRF